MTMHFFITGTDTEIGKTTVAASLLRAASARGHKSLGLKPIAAGCEWIDNQWQNEDAISLMEASSEQRAYQDINPIALKEPIAPHLAARNEGVSLTASSVSQHCRKQLRGDVFTLVEGAGGWMVPLNEAETLATVAQQLDFPVILVVGVRLGCINHALLTAQAIELSGLRLQGWIANEVEPNNPQYRDNIHSLNTRLDAPLLAALPHGASEFEFIHWEQLCR